MTPLVIHQTWTTLDLPPHLEAWSNTWKTLHPQHQHMLHTDEDNEKLMLVYFRQHKSRYESYPHNIQRVDIARLMWLYVVGGIYVDLDVECLLNTDELPDGDLLFLEPCDSRINLGTTPSNWIIMAEPESPFIERALELSLEDFRYTGSKISDVCLSTGTGLLKRAYEDCKLTDTRVPRLLPSRLFSPYTHDQVLQARQSGTELDRNINAYGIHHFEGSWWGESK